MYLRCSASLHALRVILTDGPLNEYLTINLPAHTLCFLPLLYCCWWNTIAETDPHFPWILTELAFIARLPPRIIPRLLRHRTDDFTTHLSISFRHLPASSTRFCFCPGVLLWPRPIEPGLYIILGRDTRILLVPLTIRSSAIMTNPPEKIRPMRVKANALTAEASPGSTATGALPRASSIADFEKAQSDIMDAIARIKERAKTSAQSKVGHRGPVPASKGLVVPGRETKQKTRKVSLPRALPRQIPPAAKQSNLHGPNHYRRRRSRTASCGTRYRTARVSSICGPELAISTMVLTACPDSPARPSATASAS